MINQLPGTLEVGKKQCTERKKEKRKQAGFAEPHSSLTINWVRVGVGLGLGWGAVGFGLGLG